MSNKYEGWLDFIIKNFIPGRVKDISAHIKKEAIKQNYKTKNNNIEAKVRQILPENAINSPSGPNRKIGTNTFYYDDETKFYYLSGDLLSQNSIKLTIDSNNSDPKKINKSDESIFFASPKDKSSEHDKMINIIREYAIDKGYVTKIEEIENIDLLLKKDDRFIINEVKSYKESIYVAVGQIQFYKHRLEEQYNIKSKQISALNIIGNFDLPIKFKTFLEKLEINYIKINNIKDSI